MVIQNNTKKFFCLLSGLLALQLAVAAAPDDTVVELAPFQVYEQRQNGVLLESAVSEHLSNTEILGSQSTLGELLSSEVGINSTSFGAGASRPVIRGMEGYRIGVLDGGLSTGDLSASSPDHAVTIEPLFIKGLKIDRGVAALRHGGGAIGGAVDIVPDYMPQNDMRNGMDSEIGSIYETVNNGVTGYLKTGYRKQAFAYRANILVRDTDDYEIPGFARTAEYDVNNRIRIPPLAQGKVGPNPFKTVPNTWTRTRVVALGVGWFQDASDYSMGFQNYDSRYGVPADGHTHGNPFGVSGITGPSPTDTVNIELTQNRLTGEANWEPSELVFESLRFKWAASDYSQSEFEGRFLSNDFSNRNGQATLEVSSAPAVGSFLVGLSGGANSYTNTNLSYYAGRTDVDNLETSTLQSALYAITEIKLNRTELYFGARLDLQEAERKDLANYRRSDLAPTLMVELRQPLTERVRGIISLGRTARIPNAEELYIEAPHGATGSYILPNPFLDLETAYSAEARIEADYERFSAYLSGFVRVFDDFIFLENQGYEVDGFTAYAYVQTPRAEFAGFEAKGSYQFFVSQNTVTEFSLFADYVRATDADQGEPLPRIPPLRLGGELIWEWHQWRSFIKFVHSFKQERVPREVFGTLAYQSPSAAYTQLSVGIEREVVLNAFTLKGGLRVSNLLDEEIRQHTGFLKDVAPLPGRSLQVSMSVSW